METSNPAKDRPEAADGGGRTGDTQLIESRDGFHHALLAALDQCASGGVPELWLCDPDFAAWPLGRPEVIDALTRWIGGRRRLTLLAGHYEHLALRCPRWVAWRRQWSHAVYCLQAREEQGPSVPALLYGPPQVALHMHDLGPHVRGRVYRSAVDVAACGELIDAAAQRAQESFPVTTLGL